MSSSIRETRTSPDRAAAGLPSARRGSSRARSRSDGARRLLRVDRRGALRVRGDPGRHQIAVRTTLFSKYRIQFIGKGGRVLSEHAEPSASYAIKGDEGYVRARVIESNGRMAWAQPGLVSGR